jgi:hypothetical protein
MTTLESHSLKVAITQASMIPALHVTLYLRATHLSSYTLRYNQRPEPTLVLHWFEYTLDFECISLIGFSTIYHSYLMHRETSVLVLSHQARANQAGFCG